LLLTLPLHLLATGLSLVVLTARGHGATMLRAKKDALAALPGIIAARQPDNRLQTVARVWQRLEKWSLRPLKRPAADRTRAEFTGN